MKHLLLNLFIIFTFVGLSQNVRHINMVTEMNKVVYLDGGSQTQFWGYSLIRSNGAYNASLPGPLLEINKGDSVYIHMYNDSPEDHTIHLHGLDVSQINDGVPTTSFAIHSQGTETYAFVANYEGVFLYHCHVLTTLHLTMGMYGMIIVHNYPDSTKIFNGGPSYTNVFDFLTSDMDLTWNNNTLSIPPMYEFRADYFMVNGKSGNQLYINASNQVHSYVGDTTVFRLGNIAYAQVKYIFPQELNAKAYLSDGRVLPQSFNCDTLTINPGERYTVVCVPTYNIDTDILVEYYEARNGLLQHTNHIKLNGNLSIKEGEIGDFDIYPNPATDVLFFKTLTPGSHLKIYSLSGKLLNTVYVNSFSTSVNLSHLKSGIYILKYQDKTLKVVKQ